MTTRLYRSGTDRMLEGFAAGWDTISTSILPWFAWYS